MDGDGDEPLDARARADYKAHIIALRAELDDARELPEGVRDTERIAQLEDDIDLVTRELKAASGLNGRSRKAGSAAERVRVRVTKNIGRALDQIDSKHESLGRLLKSTVRTGIFCCYQPDPRFPVEWSFDPEQSSDAKSSAPPDRPSEEARPPKEADAAPTASQPVRLGRQPAAAAPGKSDEPQIPSVATSATESVKGGRKTVTLLLVDFKRSTGLVENLDPEETRAIVDPALKLMIDAVDQYDGYVTRSTDDGIFAMFGAPIAHEDHPQRALSAALRMQAELKRYAEKLRAEKGVQMQVRAGAHTGEVVVREIRTGKRHTEYGPIGSSTSVAAQLQMMAAPGSIAIAESMRKLVEGYFTLKSLGPARINGVGEAREIYEVTGAGPLRTRFQRAAARGYTKFVGRQREMETLKHAAELAQAGRGQVVATVAEPGLGKSRLLFEFKATAQSRWLVLEAPSVSHGKGTAYLPLIDLLQFYFRITSEDDARTRREKVAGQIATLDQSLEQTLPHLLALLGIIDGEDPFAQMDPKVRRRRTQDAVKRVLLRESLNQPLMLIFEDLHWIDDETHGFLNLLADGIASASVLLLVNYRPEYTNQWSSKTYYTHLRLDPLETESAAEMLSARIGDSPELVEVKRLILARTEGNPLFIEELVEALFDEGVLVRNGENKVTRPLSQLNIPPIVQGIFVARIDLLPPHAKELLQTLAVIGSEFPLALTRQVVEVPSDRLDTLLDLLQAGEFIYEQPAAGDVKYKFKHALTHDAAYKSLLTEHRKILHGRTAQGIEAVYSRRLEDHYADLAFHYRSSDNTPKAVEYLRLAGEQAVSRGIYTQALANVEAALKLIERLPEGVEQRLVELRVRLLEGMAVSALYGMASTERLRAFKRVCELSEQLGDRSAEIQGRLNVAGVYLSKGVDIPLALETVRSCVDLAQRSPDCGLRPLVHLQLANFLHNAGDSVQASSLLDELMTHFEPGCQETGKGHLPINPWVLTPIVFFLVQQTLGRSDQALKLNEQALRRAHELKHPFSLCAAYAITASGLRFRRHEPEAARQMAEAAIALAEEHGFENWIALARSVRGWVLAGNGPTEKGIGELEVYARRMYGISAAPQMLAEAYLSAGRVDHAAGTLVDALGKCERAGMHVDEAELHRLRGEVILTRNSSAFVEAEACFRRAIEIARSQSAKWWELRATTSLARLLRDTDRLDEARTTLVEIYNWFTEGFDTPDLKDAKALLDHLTQ
jgi:class 3 adenylate cyclase